LIEDAIRGDPETPLRWVSRSQRQIARALLDRGFRVSQKLVGRLLRGLGYSCQANRKTREGTNHPDRDAQFAHINTVVQAAIAAESIRRWWCKLGKARYPQAKRLVITADCGGSNGARVRLWKRELQRFADETGLAVTVAHLPPGTSKWNRIEHRLFAHISRNWRQNWRGKPLVSHQVIVQLSHR